MKTRRFSIQFHLRRLATFSFALIFLVSLHAQGRWARYVEQPSALDAIRKALPDRLSASPKHPRRLLVFCRNVNYPGHASIPYLNTLLREAGQRFGAFQVKLSEDPQAFRWSSLSQFDAVFFNNTVGNLFTDPTLRMNLLRFVVQGGGLLGVHGTSVAFMRWPGAVEDWPEFGLMLGARGANHRENKERVVIRVEDPSHPLLIGLPKPTFEYRDEFFRFQQVYSRNHLRVLLSIDTNRTDLHQGRAFGRVFRPDNDYALAWVKTYGRGRVFYCTIGHHPDVFMDPLMARFYLAAVQFALGDLPAPTAPSRIRSPLTDAQERLGWWIVLRTPPLAEKVSVQQLAQQAQALGLFTVALRIGQPIQSGTSFDSILQPGMSQAALAQTRMILGQYGLRIGLLDGTGSEVGQTFRIQQLADALGVWIVRGVPIMIRPSSQKTSPHPIATFVRPIRKAEAFHIRGAQALLAAGCTVWIDPLRQTIRVVQIGPKVWQNWESAPADAQRFFAWLPASRSNALSPILLEVDPGPNASLATCRRAIQTVGRFILREWERRKNQ